MMRSALLDTGVLVALLDGSERNHQRCEALFREFSSELLTTEPVLTEAIYLLRSARWGRKSCVEFIVRGGAALVPQSIGSLSRANILMDKYSDIPMDFADATLVVLAEETGISDVLTLDHRGFNAYRIRGKKAFTIWPTH